MKNDNLIGIDLFSGAGGMSIGAINSGIKVPFAIERDVYAANSFENNHKGSIALKEDIRTIDTKIFKDSNPYVIFGGPPCQGFSYANKKTRNVNNENNVLYKEFIRFVEELKPTWFVFENVEGFHSFDKGDLLKYLISTFNKIGYTLNYKIMCAADYGVPQLRKRFILVGNIENKKFSFPEINANMVNVSDALSDLPSLKNGDLIDKMEYKNSGTEYSKKLRMNSIYSTQNYVSKNKEHIIERYKHVKQGNNWKSIPASLMENYSNLNNCHSGIYKRLDPNKPSVVISNYRKNMLIHPNENRGLSVREAARLQSFPDDFIFSGKLSHIQQQIGNAVPPLIAETIFNQILSI